MVLAFLFKIGRSKGKQTIKKGLRICGQKSKLTPPLFQLKCNKSGGKIFVRFGERVNF